MLRVLLCFCTEEITRLLPLDWDHVTYVLGFGERHRINPVYRYQRRLWSQRDLLLPMLAV